MAVTQNALSSVVEATTRGACADRSAGGCSCRHAHSTHRAPLRHNKQQLHQQYETGTALGDGRSGFDPLQRLQVYLFSRTTRRVLGTTQPLLGLEWWLFLPGVAQPELQARTSIRMSGDLPPSVIRLDVVHSDSFSCVTATVTLEVTLTVTLTKH